MKVGLLVPIVLLLFESLVSGQQRWYYTGRFQNEDIIIPFFEGLQYEQSELCEPNQSHLMFFGGIIAKSEVLNATEYDSVGELLRSQLLGLANSSTVTIQKAQNYPLIMSRNYAAYVEILNNRSNDTYDTLQYQAEVGLYDHRTRLFLEKYWRNLQIGELTAVEISITKSVPVAAASSSEASVDESDNFELASIDVSATGEAVLFDAEANSVSPEIVELSAEDLRNVPDTKISLFDADQRNDFVVSKHVHKVAYTSDIMGRASIYAHTWSDDSVNTKVEPTETAKKDLRIMSFNLWHNNPPSWVYHNPK